LVLHVALDGFGQVVEGGGGAYVKLAGACCGAVDLGAAGAEALAEFLLVALECPVGVGGREHCGYNAVIAEVEEPGRGFLDPEVNKNAAPVREPRFCTHPRSHGLGAKVGVGPVA
jgi:hypothetical protein